MQANGKSTMTTKNYWIAAIAWFSMLLFSVPGSAETEKNVVAAGVANEVSKAPIRNIITLPANGLKAIESDGKIILMSDNGRFVFSGEMYDTWYRTSHTTVEELKNVATKIELDRMNLDIGQLNTLQKGSGPKNVVIFIDTQCRFCHQLMKEIEPFLDEYTFQFVVSGILGEKSLQEAKAVSCAASKDLAFKAILSNKIQKLEQAATCNKAVMQKTEITKIMFGLKRAPFLIAPDGTTLSGKPRDLKKWLEANS